MAIGATYRKRIRRQVIQQRFETEFGLPRCTVVEHPFDLFFKLVRFRVIVIRVENLDATQCVLARRRVEIPRLPVLDLDLACACGGDGFSVGCRGSRRGSGG